MDCLSKDLVLIVLQFLREEKYSETVHTLEKESGFFFNMRYFKEKVDAGEWDEVEKYMSGFTKVDDNRYSMKIYYELLKQKYLEALDRAKPEALDILLKDLKVFSTFNTDLYRDMTQLLTLDNFRENEKLSQYGNTKEARSKLMSELEKLIKANPLLSDKLGLPLVRSSRLRTLINQSLSWQHQWCTNPRSMPEIKTLFTDHSCRSSNGGFGNSSVNIPATGGAMPFASVPLGIQSPIPVTADPNALAGRVSNATTASSVPPAVVPSQVSGMKRPLTPPVTLGLFDFHRADHEQSLKRLRTAQPIEEATNPAVGQPSSQTLDGFLTLGSLPTLDGGEAVGTSKQISNPVEEVVDKAKSWQFTETIDRIPWRLLTLDASETGNKVSRLLYTKSGTGILVLGSNGLQQLWKWDCDEQNPSGKATPKVVPQLWKPKSGLFMANDIAGVDLEEACPCVDISKNDSYVVSACGGKVSLFNMMTYRVMATLISLPPVSTTAVAFNPLDNNIVVVGMEDSVIYIYDVRTDEVKTILKGHQKRVTGLAFSTKLNILISSGADAHICIWSIDTWERTKFLPLQLPTGHLPSCDARVQFHSDQVHFLVSHKTQLALYDATNMDCIHQWIPQDVLSAPISCAAFTCNSQLIYASFYDGNIGIFHADSLSLRGWISPSMYTPGEFVYPVVVAAHPQDPHQFALGLTDGSVKVIEPFEQEGRRRAISQLADEAVANDRGASTSYAAEQLQR